VLPYFDVDRVKGSGFIREPPG